MNKPKVRQRKWNRVAVVTALYATATPLFAANVYWDLNGATPGAGISPAGTWNTSTANWTLDETGSSATQAWVNANNDIAFFSAAADAIGSYTVALTGNATTPGSTASAIVIEEGNVVFGGSGVVGIGAGSITIASGASLSINSSARISATTGAVFNLQGGTLINTNPAGPGSFVSTVSTITLGPAGGTFQFGSVGILNIVETNVAVSGPGTLTKTGAGVLAIASASTYGGGTIINDGELRVRGSSNRLPTTGAVTVNSPGILNLNAVSQQIGSLTGNGNVGTSNATLTISGSASTTFDGALKDVANAGAGATTTAGGKLTKSGTGVITFNGLNDITGGVTLSAGGIIVSSFAALSAPAATLTVNGGTLTLNNAAQTVSTLSGTGGSIVLGTGHSFTVDPVAAGTYSGVISGSGSLTKLNVLSGATNRTLTLSGNNTYDGATIVSGGVISVGAASALGSTLGDTTVASGAELLFTGATTNFTVNEAITIAGVGNTDNGAIAVISNANPTLAGPITLSGNATVTVSGASGATFSNPAAFTAFAGETLTLQGGSGAGAGGTISGAIGLGTGSLNKLQGGRWILSGANSYTGATSVGAGTLQFAKKVSLYNAASALWTAGNINVSSGATLALNVGGTGEFNASEASAIAALGTGTGGFLSGSNLGLDTSNAGGSFTYSSNLANPNAGANALGLSKLGSGTLVLSGSSTYTGNTTIAAGGTLQLTGSLNGTAAVSVSGTLSGNGTITPGTNGSVTIATGGKLSPGTSVGTISAVLSGTGTVNLTAGVTGTNSQSLIFELGTIANSDRVNIAGGPLNIGTTVLEFDDFAFTNLAGFDNGDYLLFDASLPIVGTLGTNVSGLVNGLDASLQFADGGNDLVLHVVPEPGTATFVFGGLAAALIRRRRDRNVI